MILLRLVSIFILNFHLISWRFQYFLLLLYIADGATRPNWIGVNLTFNFFSKKTIRYYHHFFLLLLLLLLLLPHPLPLSFFLSFSLVLCVFWPIVIGSVFGWMPTTWPQSPPPITRHQNGFRFQYIFHLRTRRQSKEKRERERENKEKERKKKPSPRINSNRFVFDGDVTEPPVSQPPVKANRQLKNNNKQEEKEEEEEQ